MPSTPLAAHVAAASLNQTVGDWAGNTRRILAAVEAARGRGARLLVLPEMCIPGYSLGDRLMMRGTLERSLALAQAHGLEEHVARAYTNLASVALNQRSYALAARYRDDGIRYCS